MKVILFPRMVLVHYMGLPHCEKGVVVSVEFLATTDPVVRRPGRELKLARKSMHVSPQPAGNFRLSPSFHDLKPISTKQKTSLGKKKL